MSEIVITGPKDALEVLDRLKRRDGGRLAATAVKKEAYRLEDKLGDSSPLHRHFTWDPEEQRDKLHTLEAQDLIRMYWVAVPEEKIKTRLFWSVEDGDSRTYRQSIGSDDSIAGTALGSTYAEMLLRQLEQATERLRSIHSLNEFAVRISKEVAKARRSLKTPRRAVKKKPVHA